MVCVLAIIALLAAILLPAIPRGTSHAQLEAYAMQIATLLKNDRNAAVRQRGLVSTEIDVGTREIRSGLFDRTVRMPDDVQFDATLASRCNQRQVGTVIVFFASGMSCGGVLALTRRDVGYQIRVNWFTGGVQVVALDH
jgi:general secretion pathway protein H